ncbi:MAG: site-2 protease family protein, partial [Gemmiger sp.]
MTGLFTLLISALVFGAVVLVHELGHFWAARHCGIRVEEFSIGFGPALFTKEKNGTLYTLRLLPLGGYNRMEAGESGEEDGEPSAASRMPAYRAHAPLFPAAVEGRSYPEASPWQRFFVIL